MTILVAIDFSEVSNTVIDSISEFASDNENIHVFHVEEPNPDFVGFDVGPEAVKEQLVDQHLLDENRLQSVVERLSSEGYSVTYSQKRGVIAEEILNQAKLQNARMIILGSHGHGAVYDLLVGSVAERVVKLSKIPVVLIPSRP